MWARIEQINADQALDLGLAYFEGDMLSFWNGVSRSDPIIGCWMGEDFVAMVGFIPQGILTGTAYVWMEWTPAIAWHKYSTVRWGKEIIKGALTQYPRLIGRCTVGEPAKRWLCSLGAKFEGDDYMIGSW